VASARSVGLGRLPQCASVIGNGRRKGTIYSRAAYSFLEPLRNLYHRGSRFQKVKLQVQRWGYLTMKTVPDPCILGGDWRGQEDRPVWSPLYRGHH
jgi:hypothetical protein